MDAGFSSKIIPSDEAHFSHSRWLLAKIVWGSEKPRIISEKQTHPQRVTVCCGFWAEGVIRPYFFENEAGRAATVNGARYRDTITRFFPPKLDDIDVADMRFQRDDATRHTANETIQLPHETFPGRVLFRFGDQNWPPRSCDLTPLDFFLRGYSKSKVYVDNRITRGN